jgi:hypothetical protein
MAFILTLIMWLANGHTRAEAESFTSMADCRAAEAAVNEKIKTDATIESALTKCEAASRPPQSDHGG